METKNPTKNIINTWQLLLIIIVFAGVLVALYINWRLLYYLSPTDRGTIGDMFGVVNALFTGLAFVGVILTIVLQRNDLKRQKEEVIRVRDEAEQQKIIFENEAIEQRKMLDLQRFETTFFNMLNLQNEIVKNIKYKGFTGREVFDEAFKKLTIMLFAANAQLKFQQTANTIHSITSIPTSIEDADDLIKDSYFPGYYDDFSSAFNHYFRHLYHIFKFIYFSTLSIKDKSFYASLCRAQLSQNELFAISFNILIDGYGKPKFLYLVREYEVLQNFDHSTITPPIYWNLIENEIANVKYPFNDKSKPDNRVVE